MASFRILEYDEADKLSATYVQTLDTTEPRSRIDVIPPDDAKSLWQKLLDVFLPVGYPHSVTKDYLEYQIYDSLQAFSSSIAGLLSSRAVLSSVGVGDSTASPTAALLLSIFQESVGRIATILFAHRFGTALEPECKMYRLLADVLNDIAFVLDCLSPIFPKSIRVIILSFSSVLRALCGVAAGSAKASLSAHFAKWGNLGELNAKDSSQETVISLLGMLVGSFVVTWVTSVFASWAVLILLLSIHLETNRRAVRAVCMRTLNRQRATLVFHHLQNGYVPSPEEISQEERIFEHDGALRSREGQLLGFCLMGASVSQLLGFFSQPDETTEAFHLKNRALNQLFDDYKTKCYIMWYDQAPKVGDIRFNIIMKRSATTSDVLVAWWEALSIACAADAYQSDNKPLTPAAQLLHKYEKQLAQKGWDLSTNSLETTGTLRIQLSNEKP